MIDRAPQEYWEIGIAQSLNIPLDTWETMDIHHKAKLRARFQLSNIAEIIKQHFDLQQQAREKALKKRGT